MLRADGADGAGDGAEDSAEEGAGERRGVVVRLAVDADLAAVDAEEDVARPGVAEGAATKPPCRRRPSFLSFALSSSPAPPRVAELCLCRARLSMHVPLYSPSALPREKRESDPAEDPRKCRS